MTRMPKLNYHRKLEYNKQQQKREKKIGHGVHGQRFFVRRVRLTVEPTTKACHTNGTNNAIFYNTNSNFKSQ